jgi:hypothetical protein
MSQGFDKLKPEYQADLLSGPVRTNFNSLATWHKGPTAPPNPDDGWVWVDDSDATNVKVKMFLFSAWRTILQNIQAGPPSQTQLDKFVHTQVVASLTWTVNHNLNGVDLLVQVWDSTSHPVIPNDITMTSVNQIVITFVAPVAGRAVVIQ